MAGQAPPTLAPTHADPDSLLDSRALRVLCGNISDMTARRWIDRGIIPAPIHIERRRFWRRGDVLAALAAHREPAPPSPSPEGPARARGA